VPTLESVVPLEKLTHMVVTHLSPKRIPSLRGVLALRAKRQPTARLEVIMSNPALQLFRTTLGMWRQACGSGRCSLLRVSTAESIDATLNQHAAVPAQMDAILTVKS